MPIKRGGDGEIVEEPTEPVRGRDGAGAANAAEDKPTDRVAARSGRDADSLFEPRSGAKGHRLEEPTVAMGTERGGDGKTRIVAPRRRTDEAETPADDPMLDPPASRRAASPCAPFSTATGSSTCPPPDACATRWLTPTARWASPSRPILPLKAWVAHWSRLCSWPTGAHG